MKTTPKMVTPAAEAARRARRAEGRAPVSWRPLSLRWRRLRVPKTAAPGPAPAAAGSWSTIFSPQVVFNFTSIVSPPAVSGAAPPAAQPASIFRERRTVQHHRTLVQRTTSRESVVRQAAAAAAPAASVPVTPATRILVFLVPGVPVHRFPAVETRLKSITAGSTHVSRFTTIARHLGRHDRQSPPSMPQPGQPPAQARMDLPLPGRSAATSPVVRPPELVWRRSAQQASNSATRGEGHRGLFDAARPGRPTAPGSFLPAAQPPAAAATPPSAPKFDAAQMDRLVDDVIHRVEKRVRVERERRGW